MAKTYFTNLYLSKILSIGCDLKKSAENHNFSHNSGLVEAIVTGFKNKFEKRM